MSRNVACVRISLTLLVEMMREGYSVERGLECVQGVPADANFVSSFFDHTRQCGVLVFQHNLFAEVQEGELLPVIEVIHKEKEE